MKMRQRSDGRFEVRDDKDRVIFVHWDEEKVRAWLMAKVGQPTDDEYVRTIMVGKALGYK